MEYWSIGVLEYWSVGALERWSVRALEFQRTIGPQQRPTFSLRFQRQRSKKSTGMRADSFYHLITPLLQRSITPILRFPLLPCIQPLFACVEQAIFRARSQRIDAPRLGSILACLATRYENQESTS
jgi:hypothetical protein